MNELKKKGYTEKQQLQDYRATFNCDAGQKVLNDLILRHFVLESTLHTDPAVMAHREGQRDVVLGILHYLQLKPEDIPQQRQSVLEQFAREDLDGSPAY